MQKSIKIFNSGKSLYQQGKLGESLTHFEKSLALDPKSAQSNSNLLLNLNYQSDYDPAKLLRAHQDFDERHCRPLAESIKPHTNKPEPERRLRIGYVSPDLRGHSVAFFIAPILTHHNANKAEVFAYYNHPQADAFTHNMQQLCQHWRNIFEMTDKQVVEQIRNDGIDILIDLAGHSAHNRLQVFAYKPAPVQVTWLGYPNTTGLSAIDYRLSDKHVDPEGEADSYHSEKLMRLPDNFLCYSPLRKCPDITPPPSVANGYITFASLNNFSKINADVINLWIKILKSVEKSRLVLIYNNPDKTWVNNAIKNAQSSAEIPFACLRALTNLEYAKKAFNNAGLGADRIMIRGRTPTSEMHLQLYQHIDIALDPFPYNGTTTTMESLWMGVPVIAKTGTTHASRVSASLLTTLGLSELTGESDNDYIAAAKHLASDSNKLATLRASLRNMMSRSTLMNAQTFTSNLESVYRTMWKKWCNQNN